MKTLSIDNHFHQVCSTNAPSLCQSFHNTIIHLDLGGPNHEKSDEYRGSNQRLKFLGANLGTNVKNDKNLI